MPTYRDRAIALRTHKLGEADRIVTFLTRGNGKVRAVARGVRRTSSKLGSRAEPFHHSDIQFAVGRGSLDVVAQAVTVHAFGEALVNDYGAYTAGQVMLETADRVVPEEREPSLQQYLLLVGALRTLVSGSSDGPRPPTMVLDAYLLRAVATAGYAPSLDDCAQCGRSGPHEAFSPISGGSVCVRCRPPGSTRPRTETIDYLKALLTGDWPATRSIESVVQREASGLVASYSQWHLDRGLRTLRYVDRDQTEGLDHSLDHGIDRV